MMRAAFLLAGLMAVSAVPAAEPEIEPLDADFLEYLANLEGDDDDWTLLAEAGRKPASSSASKDQSQPQKAPKPGKETAKPAAEER